MRLGSVLVRELRVLCRKRLTYALRTVLTSLILAISALMILDGDAPRQLAVSATVAQILFSFGAALAISDTIASERRNRTLGLLILTPLRPAEILLGKLFTTASQFLLCLFAILPILALPVLGGSITWQDVLKPFAGILAGILLGMVVGLFASVTSTRATRVLGLSFTLVALLFFLPSVCYLSLDLEGLLDHYWFGPAILVLSHTDPPAELGSWSSNLAIVLGICLVFFLLARILFLVSWAREKVGRVAERTGKPSPAPSGGRRIRQDDNPCAALMRWLHPYSRFLPGLATLLVFLSLGVLSYDFIVALMIPIYGFDTKIQYILIVPTLAIIYWDLIPKSAGPVHGMIRNGMLEPILASPLSSRSILDGFTGRVRSRSRWYTILIQAWNLLLLLALAIHYLLAGRYDPDYHQWYLPLHLGLFLTIPLELNALRWTCLWMGLTRRNLAGTTALLFLGYAVAPFALLFVFFIITYDFLGIHSPLPALLVGHAVKAYLAMIFLVECRCGVLRAIHRRVLPLR